MSYNFTMQDMNEFSSYTNTMKNYLIKFPKNLGFIKSNKELITQDISLFKTQTEVKENIFVQANSNTKNLIINIVLDGEILYRDNILNKNEFYKKHNCYLKYVNSYDTTMILNKNSSKIINIIIKDEFLEKSFKDIFNLSSFDNLPSITLKNQLSKNIHLANELYNSPFEGELQNIYLQSKVLELIYNEFSEMLNFKEQENKKVKLNQDDIEALHKVRNLILLENDFSDLMSLSKKVRLNEFKLKYGFKQLFNTTIGQMILEQKMLYAKQLLETSEFSISEISSFVGYKHQQNFSTAFMQFFGIRPKDIMVRREYYY